MSAPLAAIKDFCLVGRENVTVVALSFAVLSTRRSPSSTHFKATTALLSLSLDYYEGGVVESGTTAACADESVANASCNIARLVRFEGCSRGFVRQHKDSVTDRHWVFFNCGLFLTPQVVSGGLAVYPVVVLYCTVLYCKIR